MMHRNRFTSQLSGVRFKGISTEKAAGILMQWKQSEKQPRKNVDDGSPPVVKEHEFLEIPNKIEYLDNWGKSNILDHYKA